MNTKILFTLMIAVVEKNLHLISEFAMNDTLCPISDSMGYGMMDIAMMESQMGDMNMMANNMFYHFTTIDTTKIGNGHEGHH
ncbi:MAG: hypothetical protein Q8K98_12660 [Bacteroidota bacterium]|nr:hypothetical protein [Bacteroidota bacterium]